MAQFYRLGCFRESVDNPILSSLPNMSRSISSTTQDDLKNFFHCVSFDPKVVSAEHKFLRQGDFKQHVNAALGLALDESPSGSTKGKMMQSPIPEEIKRVKAVLHETGIKARERVKIFNEALSVFDKFFPTVPSKKRSQSEGFPGVHSGALLSSDRSGLGPNMEKIGMQSHSISGSFELEQQTSKKGTKTSRPNKRMGTSFVDAKTMMTPKDLNFVSHKDFEASEGLHHSFDSKNPTEPNHATTDSPSNSAVENEDEHLTDKTGKPVLNSSASAM